jgi:hypothetical protein
MLSIVPHATRPRNTRVNEKNTLRTVLIARLYLELSQHIGTYMRQSLPLDVTQMRSLPAHMQADIAQR